MGHREHPKPDLLLRFLRDEVSASERRAVVRHLLTGCPECVAITRPAWTLPDYPRRTKRMRSEPETEAKEQLREIVAELEAIRFRLLGIQASLPDSPAERFPPLEQEDMDPWSEIRSIIGCVLNDSIRPAIRDLRNMAGPPPSPEGARRDVVAKGGD
jgi:hypothetical protein